MLPVRIRRLDPAVPLPDYQTPGAAGFDLAAAADVEIPAGSIALVPTGLVIQVPAGHFLGIFARSSTPLKRGLMVANGVGVIDEDYCGPADEVKIQVLNFTAGAGPREARRSARAGTVHPCHARGVAGDRRRSARGLARRFRTRPGVALQIYLACTVRGDRGAVAGLRGARAALERAGHTVLTKHLLDDNVEGAESALTERAVYERDIAWLEACDVLIADASGSSFGVGFEVGYVLGRSDRTDQQVVLLYRADRRDQISRLIVGNAHPRCEALSYENGSDLSRLVGAALAVTGGPEVRRYGDADLKVRVTSPRARARRRRAPAA